MQNSRMIAWLQALRRGFDALSRFAAALSAVAIVFACFAITWAVLGRGLWGMSTIWELEASVYLLIYAAFLSVAYSDRTGGQIAIEILRKRFRGRSKIWHRTLMDVISLFLFVLLFRSGLEMFLNVWENGWRSETLWGPPLWIPYLAIPLGCAIFIPVLILDIIARLVGIPVAADDAMGEH